MMKPEEIGELWKVFYEENPGAMPVPAECGGPACPVLLPEGDYFEYSYDGHRFCTSSCSEEYQALEEQQIEEERRDQRQTSAWLERQQGGTF
jgi:hypothetical protein